MLGHLLLWLFCSKGLLQQSLFHLSCLEAGRRGLLGLTLEFVVQCDPTRIREEWSFLFWFCSSSSSSGSTERFPPSAAIFHASICISDNRHGSLLPVSPLCPMLRLLLIMVLILPLTSQEPCSLVYFPFSELKNVLLPYFSVLYKSSPGSGPIMHIEMVRQAGYSPALN